MELQSLRFKLIFICWLLVFVQTRAPTIVRGDAMSPEACSTETSTSCQAMVGYVPSSNVVLSRMASLFSLQYTSLLGPNNIEPDLANLSNLVLPSDNVYNIPQTCSCVNGTRTVTSIYYTVQSGDTLSKIADSYYSGLISYQEIAEVNNILNPDLIEVGQNFTIPILCACGDHAASSALLLSYQIQSNDTASSIAASYNTSVSALQQLNPTIVDSTLTSASILFVPLAVCTANFSSEEEDAGIRVVEGTYQLTANECVQCSCTNGTLHCVVAPQSVHISPGTCSNTTCLGSNLTLGAYYAAAPSSKGGRACTLESCIYKGYNAKSGITSILETQEEPTCPVAPPPETFYKPPLGLVASPLGATSSTPQATSPTSTPAAAAAPPASSSTPNSPAFSPRPSSASKSALQCFFSSSFWWWCLLGLAGINWLLDS